MRSGNGTCSKDEIWKSWTVFVLRMRSGNLGWLLERVRGRQYTFVCVHWPWDAVVTELTNGNVALGEVVTCRGLGIRQP